MKACLSVFVLAGLFFLNACAVMVPQTAATATTSAATSAGTHAAYNEGLPPSGGTMDGRAKYFDFKGIKIPPKLGLEKDESFVFSVGEIKAGVLAFKGSLEFSSLRRFFVESMAQDGWELLAATNYPRTALFFAKDDRSCIIRIWETHLYSKVQIWVTPSRESVKQFEALTQ